jgi:hypothetical protein
MITFDIFADIETVGFNPEIADMRNPDGRIEREVYFLRAMAKDGSQWLGDCFTTDLSGIVRVKDHLNRLVAQGINVKLDADWVALSPVYGSEAWEREQGQEIEAEIRADMEG